MAGPWGLSTKEGDSAGVLRLLRLSSEPPCRTFRAQGKATDMSPPERIVTTMKDTLAKPVRRKPVMKHGHSYSVLTKGLLQPVILGFASLGDPIN